MNNLFIIEDVPDVTSRVTIGVTLSKDLATFYVDQCINGHLIKSLTNFELKIKDNDDLVDYLIDIRTSINSLINKTIIKKQEISLVIKNENQQEIFNESDIFIKKIKELEKNG